MPTDHDQPESENIDPDAVSTPAGLVGDLEEEARETGATTEADDAPTDR